MPAKSAGFKCQNRLSIACTRRLKFSSRQVQRSNQSLTKYSGYHSAVNGIYYIWKKRSCFYANFHVGASGQNLDEANKLHEIFAWK